MSELFTQVISKLLGTSLVRLRSFSLIWVRGLFFYFVACALVLVCPAERVGATPPAPPSVCPGCFTITAASGNGQTGNISSILPAPLVVKVTSTQTGVALSNFGVTLTVGGGAGAGLLNGSTTRMLLVVFTGADGTASVQMILGNSPGQYQVTADCPPGPNCIAATFTETATRLGLSRPTNLRANQIGSNGTQIQLTWDYGNDPIETRPLHGTTFI